MLKKLCLALALATAAFSQSFNNEIVGTVPQVSALSVSTVGAQGTTTYCYWVVAVYTGGKSAPYGPACLSNSNGTLSATNYNVVKFTAPSGTVVAPTGYDLLRTTTTNIPSGTANLSVSTAQSGSPLNDQSNTVSSYTVATLTGQYYEYLDLISNASPVITPVINGNVVGALSSQNGVYAVTGSITDAQLATGRVIVTGVTGHTMTPLSAAIIPVGGTVAACTAINITDSALGATDTFSFLVSGSLTARLW